MPFTLIAAGCLRVSKSSSGERDSVKVVYKITYPNGKIYVGKDATDTLCYFETPNSQLIARDFPRHTRTSFTIVKEILWESDKADDRELSLQELRFIRELKANEPDIGYNQWPRRRKLPGTEPA